MVDWVEFTSRPALWTGTLRRLTKGIEFWARVSMVNLPSYVLANSVALDRICMALFTYLLFQVVGITWASLVNAAFALACELSYIVHASMCSYHLLRAPPRPLMSII